MGGPILPGSQPKSRTHLMGSSLLCDLISENWSRHAPVLSAQRCPLQRERCGDGAMTLCERLSLLLPLTNRKGTGLQNSSHLCACAALWLTGCRLHRSSPLFFWHTKWCVNDLSNTEWKYNWTRGLCLRTQKFKCLCSHCVRWCFTGQHCLSYKKGSKHMVEQSSS